MLSLLENLFARWNIAGRGHYLEIRLLGSLKTNIMFLNRSCHCKNTRFRWLRRIKQFQAIHFDLWCSRKNPVSFVLSKNLFKVHPKRSLCNSSLTPQTTSIAHRFSHEIFIGFHSCLIIFDRCILFTKKLPSEMSKKQSQSEYKYMSY